MTEERKNVGCGYCCHEGCEKHTAYMSSGKRKAGGTRLLALSCDNFESILEKRKKMIR